MFLQQIRQEYTPTNVTLCRIKDPRAYKIIMSLVLLQLIGVFCGLIDPSTKPSLFFARSAIVMEGSHVP